MYDESIYDEVERYLKVSLAKWRDHLPELWEDAFQEGMIQAWRDVEADVQPKLKLLRRASMTAEKYLHRNGEYSFGKPKKSREGIRRNHDVLDKVQVFLEEYMPVHNNIWPTPTIAAKALGITDKQAHTALKAIKSGNIDHMVYREDGRKDWGYYSTVSVELLHPGKSTNGWETNRSWTDNPQMQHLAESFEDFVISEHNFVDILKKLAPEYREILYLFCAEQYNRGDLGRHIGTYSENVTSQGGTKRLNAAINQARLALGIFQGQCSAKHIRSAETSEIRTRDNGQFYYKCKICKVEPPHIQAAREAKANGKAKVGDPCGNGHFKDKVNSKGYARCSQCLNDRQKEYLKRKAEGK